MNKKLFLIVSILLSLAFIFGAKVDAATNITKIEITLDTEKAVLHPYYTYNQVRSIFEKNWSVPEEAGYSRGNNNIWFYYCPDENKCVDGYEQGYGQKIEPNRFTWVEFEIYAKPVKTDVENPDYDFDPDHLDEIEVWLNGVKRDDAIVEGYNSSWREVDVKIPFEVDDSPIVKSISVNSEYENVVVGESANFEASVIYYGDGWDEVNWTVIGNTSEQTIMDGNLLIVGADEQAETVTVRATSTHDNTVYGEKTVNILQEPLVIDSVEIAEKNAVVVLNNSYTFHATITGTAPKSIVWTVTGNTSVDTVITNAGKLFVAPDEEATSITVVATSSYDNTKYDSVTVTLKEHSDYIEKIEITYDENEVIFSTKTTYNQVREKMKKNWSVPEEAAYSKGNNNVWMYYCEDENRCTDDLTHGYGENLLEGRFTWIEFEVFAKPVGNELENPDYDFDKDHLDEIEIWINGVKREDAIILGYNSSWRNIGVFVPVTITNDKLTQELSFYADYANVTYGDNNFMVEANHKIGDGEVVYSSSNTNVAEVNATTGEVTIKNVGTAIITATAKETEDFKAKSISCPVTVAKKSIFPLLDTNNFEYTGESIKPDFTVTFDGKELKKGIDYTLDYGENINVGDATVVITPVDTSNYTFDEREVTFGIYQKGIEDQDVTVPDMVAYMDGEDVAPQVKVVVSGRTLVENTDYTVSYSNQTGEIGEYVYITIKGIGNYKSTVYKEVLIEKKEVVYALKTPVLKVAKGSNNSLVISWNAQELEETYYLYRSLDNKKWSKIAETKLASYTDKSLKYGTRYYYKVYAKNDYSKTGYSNVANRVVVPNTVTNFKNTSASQTSLVLKWTGTANSGYEIYTSANNKTWTKLATIAKKTITSYTHKNLKANSVHYYKIRAYQIVNGKKIYGAFTTVISSKTAPLAPKVSVSLRDYNALNVTVKKTAGAVKYEIYRSTSKTGTYTKVGELNKEGTFVDNTVITGKTYYYKVRACNSQGRYSTYSTIVSIKVTPKKPNLVVTQSATKKVNVEVKKVNGVAGYEVYRSTSKTGKFTKIKTLTDENNLSFVNSTNKGTTYYYKVVAYTIVGKTKVYSPYSELRSIKSK